MTTMTAPPSTKYLSSTAILVLAANTMNGPGMTTLPDVAANAGRALYILLIALSAGMAAFVCRRMVYAMWRNDGSQLQTTTMTTAPREGSVELLDVHDKFVDESFSGGSSTATERTSLLNSSTSSQLSAHVAEQQAGCDNVHQQPILELTSIVGQSREAFDNNLPDDVAIGKQTRHTPPSTYVALLMVASALCLGLAQMVRTQVEAVDCPSPVNLWFCTNRTEYLSVSSLLP